jgi:hypothetical protein
MHGLQAVARKGADLAVGVQAQVGKFSLLHPQMYSTGLSSMHHRAAGHRKDDHADSTKRSRFARLEGGM